ncbi:hypothetical protein [Sphingobium sp. SYK-6]|uniref:hypothetical protein n=1 Tax=Sphingobium sp. (strain NBRC 103272 / SYK-6) TaxID=627192 RepID=UPI0011D1C2A4|nr:hypothetical protein [Sphingobium sp. SYK-6]
MTEARNVDALQDKDRALHEMIEALTAIQLGASAYRNWLAKGPAEAGQARQCLGDILDQTSRLQSVVEALLREEV